MAAAWCCTYSKGGLKVIEGFFASLVAMAPAIMAVALILGGVMILARSVVAFSRPAAGR